MRRTLGRKKLSVAVLIAATCLAAFAPTAFAAAPGPSGTQTPTGAPAGSWQYAPQSPQWLALKNAGRIRSGVTRGQAKGTSSHPYVARYGVCCGGGNPPAAYQLYEPSDVTGAFEPSGGGNPNYGLKTPSTDDGGHHYSDVDFFDLCGPGAADIALWYWPTAPSGLTDNYVTDTAHTSTSTYWKSERLRGYMMDLAWQTQWPGWPHPGMMDNAHYHSYGVTLYGMQDGLNWEASGHNTSTWSTYYYTIQWHDSATASTLHNDIVADTYDNNVAVVAEVNAAMLPNWRESGDIHHFITIVGYDDNAGTYSYTDTCASSTTCNPTAYGKDGTVLTVSQSTMWNAITSITVNKSTDPAYGDGGWVW